GVWPRRSGGTRRSPAGDHRTRLIGHDRGIDRPGRTPAGSGERAFEPEQVPLGLGAPRVPAQRLGGLHRPVARHEQADRVRAERAAHRPHRLRPADARRDVPIGRGRAVRHGEHHLEHGPHERRRELEIGRGGEGAEPAFEVRVELPPHRVDPPRVGTDGPAQRFVDPRVDRVLVLIAARHHTACGHREHKAADRAVGGPEGDVRSGLALVPRCGHPEESFEVPRGHWRATSPLTAWRQRIGACPARGKPRNRKWIAGTMGDVDGSWVTDGDADGVAGAVVASAPAAVVAVDRDLAVVSWNAAAERLFGWQAEELVGKRAPIVPRELMAEHNAVLERVRTGGRVSLRSRRYHRDGRLLDVRVDTSALRSPTGALLGYVSVYHSVEDDDAAQGGAARRARLVRRLTDVVADINADLDLPIVLDRIAASLTELTGADAGAFASIEGDRLRLVGLHRLPEEARGSTAELATSLVGKLLRTG